MIKSTQEWKNTVSEHISSLFEYGTTQEINALGSLVGKVMSVYFRICFIKKMDAFFFHSETRERLLVEMGLVSILKMMKLSSSSSFISKKVQTTKPSRT